jgi:hypothetical protein
MEDDNVPNDIFALCLTAPREVYNRNVVCARFIKSDNPFIDDKTYYRMQCFNLLARGCEHMPPCTAVLILFWLAKIHAGVRLTIIDSMQTGARQHSKSFATEFLAFTDTVIHFITTRRITENSMPKRALYFYALFIYVERYRFLSLIKTVEACTQTRISKPEKRAIVAAYKKRCVEKGRDVGNISEK